MEFERHLIRKIEDVALSIRHSMKVMESMMDTEHFTAAVATVMKKKIEKTVKDVLKKEDRRQKLV